jgi:hypothetical protein
MGEADREGEKSRNDRMGEGRAQVPMKIRLHGGLM